MEGAMHTTLLQGAAVNATIWAYITYMVASVGLTVWVAHTLHKNGRIFLVDSFLGNEALADSVNRLLVVGFYLINVGFVSLALKYGLKPRNTVEGIEFFSTKMGMVLLVLGGMHFFNLYVFATMRRKAMLKHQRPPVQPEGFLAAKRT
jgi:hypothetical protein